MEGTALSLAKLTLETVLPVAKQAVANEAGLLLGVRQEVSFIANELEMMQAFLRAAGAGDRALPVNEVVKIWVKQVRDLAYDVEDCIQEYLALNVRGGVDGRRGRRDAQPSSSSSRVAMMMMSLASWAPSHWIRACLVPTGRLRDQHRIAVRIREVKASVEEVSKRNLRYSIVVQPAGPIGPVVAKDQMAVLATDVVTAAEDSMIVGRDKLRDDLLACILTPTPSSLQPQLQVVAIWGMGGMGKTVLVRHLLRNSEVARAFDCHAWVTVPHPFNPAEFLRTFVGQLDMEAGCMGACSSKRIRARAAYGEVMQLMNEVLHHLEDKRYIVVIDNVSSVAEEWEHIKKVLPDKSNGSRVIVTTRCEDVANHCSTKLPVHLYKLEKLSDEDSLHLLCTKARIKCPPSNDILAEARDILARCAGLPLAIAAVGGLLATKPTPAEWRMLHDHLGFELKINPGLKDFNSILTSSYDGLPYHLKSCFLYLSIFHKHHQIRRARIVWRWMAEGLVTESRDMTPEDVGENRFLQLISRSMIFPPTRLVTNPNRRLKICRVHDMMHEIILAKSMEENQLFVLDEDSAALPREKIRHLLVQGTCRGKENILTSINMSHIRSLTVAGEQCPPQLIVPSKMKMLRVLDLEDCPGSKDSDLTHIGELRHLKYLGLRKTSVSKLPESLGRLKFLETLDVRDTKVSVLPQGITKLEKLRHLLAGNGMRVDYDNPTTYMTRKPSPRRMLTRLASSSTWRPIVGGGYSFPNYNINMQPCNGVRLPTGMKNLRNLRVLAKIDVTSGQYTMTDDIKKMTALQSLSIGGLTEKDGPEFGEMVRELRRLQHIEICSNSKPSKHGIPSLCWLEGIALPTLNLLSLRLYGHLGKLPKWIGSLKDIIKIKLLDTELVQVDAIEVLGDLPNLAALHLWSKSYVRDRMHLSANKFKKLKLMEIDGLEHLVSLEIEDKAVPQLESLRVYRCYHLKDDEGGITGVLFLSNLRELRLKHVGDKRCIEAFLQRQVSEHHNKPLFITSLTHVVG